MLHPIATFLVLVSFATPAAALPTTLDLEPIRGLPVQHDGRWPPLDTLARDTVQSVTGQAFHQDHDPVLLLLAWTFDPETWQHEPLIEIKNAELRTELRREQAALEEASREVKVIEKLEEKQRQRHNLVLARAERAEADEIGAQFVRRHGLAGGTLLVAGES